LNKNSFPSARNTSHNRTTVDHPNADEHEEDEDDEEDDDDEVVKW
jgi:hypothetical protein